MSIAFRFEAVSDDNGTWLVTVPALPEVTTFAEIKPAPGAEVFDAARRQAVAAIEEALAARISAGEALPRPDGKLGDELSAPLPLLTALKASLYEHARLQEVTRAELVRRLGWNRESVDRLFRLDHLSRLSQLEEAYAALGLLLRAEAIPVSDEAKAALARVARKREVA
jgi:antitoxin HicB